MRNSAGLGFAIAVALFAAAGVVAQVGMSAAPTTQSQSQAQSQPVSAELGSAGSRLSAMAECLPGSQAGRECVEEVLVDVLEQEGGAAAMGVLLEGGKTDLALQYGCHDYAHLIGIAAFETYPSIDDAFADGDPNCQFGYFHGVLIGAAAEIESDDEFAAAVPQLCSFFDEESYSVSYCIHGIGHASAARTPADVLRAAAACDVLELESQQTWCTGGVLMEWSSSFVPEAVTEGRLSVADVEGICDDFREPMVPVCVRNASAAWLNVNNGDVTSVLKLCDRFDGLAFEYCYVGMGSKIVFAAQLDDAQIVEMCSSGSAKGVGMCAGGAADSMFGQFYRTEPERASELCEAFEADAARECADRLQLTLAGYESVGDEIGETGFDAEIDVTGFGA